MSADIRDIRLALPKEGWLKSSRCNLEGNCVELNLDTVGLVRVRDSKGCGDTVLAFAGAPWSAFLRALPVVP